MSHGRDPHEVIVSFDPVAVDAYTCGLFGLKPADIGYFIKAAERGLGESDPNKIAVERLYYLPTHHCLKLHIISQVLYNIH
jgi:uncharacterized protein (DUF362 family)